MGATAFVMAQFIGSTYAEVASAAIIPAILYYAGLFMQVDAYAARHGLKGLERRELPRLWETFQDGWYYAFVVVVLIVMLLYFKRESHAPFYATALLLVLNQWEQPGKWQPINTIALLVAIAATVVMTLRGEGYVKAMALPAGAPGAFDAWMNAVLLPLLGGMLLLVVLNELRWRKALGLRQVHQLPRSQRPHLRRTGRHPGRLRPADRRLLADRRHLLAGQRSPVAWPAATRCCCSPCAPSPA